MTDKPKRIAVCAPGYETITSVVLALRDEYVDEIVASPVLQDPVTILIVECKPFDIPPMPVADPPMLSLMDRWMWGRPLTHQTVHPIVVI